MDVVNIHSKQLYWNVKLISYNINKICFKKILIGKKAICKLIKKWKKTMCYYWNVFSKKVTINHYPAQLVFILLVLACIHSWLLNVDLTVDSLASCFNIICRSSHWKCFVKKVFLEISQNSRENTCTRDSFLKKFTDLGLQLY